MVTRDKEDHYIIIEVSIHQDDIIIINIYIYLPMMEHQNIKKILTDLREKYTTIQQ